MNVLDEIRSDARMQGVFWPPYVSIEIVSGCSPPVAFDNHMEVEVGEGWFTKEQWAGLMALRLQGKIKLRRQGGRCYIDEGNRMGGVFDGVGTAGVSEGFKVFVDCGVKAKDAADAFGYACRACSSLVGDINA